MEPNGFTEEELCRDLVRLGVLLLGELLHSLFVSATDEGVDLIRSEDGPGRLEEHARRGVDDGARHSFRHAEILGKVRDDRLAIRVSGGPLRPADRTAQEVLERLGDDLLERIE